MKKNWFIFALIFVGLVGFCYYQVLHMHPQQHVLSAATVQENNRVYPTIKVGELMDNFSFENTDNQTITTIQATKVGENSTLEDFGSVKIRMLNKSYDSLYKRINNAMCILFINNTKSFEKSIFCIQKDRVISVVVNGQIMENVSKDFDLVMRLIRF